MDLSQADEFRRLMSRFRDAEEMEAMRQIFVSGAITTHKVHPAQANRVFDIVSKFVGYGFCRSHAAAFARTVYQSAYLKAHHPAAYMAAVLEHKPGFYPMHTLLEEARLLGVRVLPPCLLRSGVKYSLEKCGGGDAIRVPLTQIKDVATESARFIVLERMLGAFTSPEDAFARLELARDEWENLARAGALDVWGERRETLYRVRAALRQKPRGERAPGSGQLQLSWQEESSTRGVQPFLTQPFLAQLRPEEQTQWDFETMHLTTGQHPVALRRPDLERLGLRRLPL
jgi:DNA polymerase III alpha subunit